MNIKFLHKIGSFPLIAFLRPWAYYFKWVTIVSIMMSLCAVLIYHNEAYSAKLINEPIQACVIARDVDLTNEIRAKFAQCLGWESDQSTPLCLGSYQPLTVTPLASPDEIHITADKASFYRDQRSSLTGNVEIQQTQRIVNAQTAYVYRDSKTNQVTKIEFLGNVHYLEPDKLMIARKAVINPQDTSGTTEDVLYRFNVNKRNALLPAWGRASLIERFANKNYLLRRATYTTCAPQDKAWDIEADSIQLDDAHATGVARNAKLRIRNVPVFYAPYFSFPTSKERKSGFLMPIAGYSNVGGFDLGIPYYWNIAPNYDMTLIPHLYTERGVMIGGEYRFLTANSFGILTGNILPHDRAFSRFLENNELLYPRLQNNPTDRWSFGILETTSFTPNLQLHIDVQQVSDDYYLQDFSNNLALITQRQLLRHADLTYTTEHWILRGMAQSYQTLHPVNEIPVTSVYEQLPQVMARGFYYDLPFNANLNILAQYDQFSWPNDFWNRNFPDMPQGPRFHLNPVLSVPFSKPWGYVTPSAQFVENYYSVQDNREDFMRWVEHPSWGFNSSWMNHNTWDGRNQTFNRFIPRVSVDSGLYFDRQSQLFGNSFTQTLEPRLYYLRVPYQNQTPIPVYDSGFMIFNMDQLFRTNRFSGFDRIGDANQLSYAVTTRWISNATGMERANLSVGQIKYFSDRLVQLCQSPSGFCIDNPYTFGSQSSVSETSPIASRAVYFFNPVWSIMGDYIWDPATSATNNGDLNLRYQPKPRTLINFGYSYLVNGDVTQVRYNDHVDNALNQAIVAFSLPLTERWSTVGAYSQNISKNYSMMSLLGLEYDSCCWAMRVLGGRTFRNLNAEFAPVYNNNVYLQVLLKGLGSISTSDPYNVLNTYIPGYNDPFRR